MISIECEGYVQGLSQRTPIHYTDDLVNARDTLHHYNICDCPCKNQPSSHKN